jgi:hypothetical protein
MPVLDDLPGLVELRNLLKDTTHIANCKNSAVLYAEHVRHMFGTSNLHSVSVDNCAADVANITSAIDSYLEKSSMLIQNIQHEIDLLTQDIKTSHYYKQNLDISPASRKNWGIARDAMIELVSEFNAPDVWKYPVACINVQHHGVLDLLAPANLIYLVDADQDLLDAAYQDEPQIHTRIKKHKLLSWEVLDFSSNLTRVRQNLRWGLPQGQISHVFCWNIFERYTYEQAVLNLTAIKDILRPGGKCIFSVNNGDSLVGAQAAAAGTSSYMTKDMIIRLLEQCGLELNSCRLVIGDNTFMVVAQAPGTLSSVKSMPPRGLIKKS